MGEKKKQYTIILYNVNTNYNIKKWTIIVEGSNSNGK